VYILGMSERCGVASVDFIGRPEAPIAKPRIVMHGLAMERNEND
jgi:hypothetical protein